MTRFTVSHQNPDHTVCVGHFTPLSSFLPKSRSYFISHISRFSLFLITIQILQCMFLIFFVFQFLTTFPVLPCEFLIFLICQFSCHIPVPTVGNFHFSRFLVFLAIFQVLQCTLLIFHVIQCFSPHSRLYSVCVSFSTFFSFLAIFYSLQFSF